MTTAHQLTLNNLPGRLENENGGLFPLDLLFAQFHHLITRPADIPRLNETILQLAVQGKLVPQNPADEPASALAGVGQ